MLKGVDVHTVPHLSGKSARPYLEIVQVTKEPHVIYSGKSIPDLRKYKDSGAQPEIHLFEERLPEERR